MSNDEIIQKINNIHGKIGGIQLNLRYPGPRPDRLIVIADKLSNICDDLIELRNAINNNVIEEENGQTDNN